MHFCVFYSSAVKINIHPMVGQLLEKHKSSFLASVYRRKYHEESTKVSIVSVSLLASLPHLGHSHLQIGLMFLMGYPSKTISRGNSTGKSSSGTGNCPTIIAVDYRDWRARIFVWRSAMGVFFPIEFSFTFT